MARRDARGGRAAVAPVVATAGRPLVLRLYVAGAAPNSIAALANLRALRGALTDHALEVVDVLKQPERALADDVLVTPMLVKLAPPPLCRIVGNLSDMERVLRSLGLPGAGS